MAPRFEATTQHSDATAASSRAGSEYSYTRENSATLAKIAQPGADAQKTSGNGFPGWNFDGSSFNFLPSPPPSAASHIKNSESASRSDSRQTGPGKVKELLLAVKQAHCQSDDTLEYRASKGPGQPRALEGNANQHESTKFLLDPRNRNNHVHYSDLLHGKRVLTMRDNNHAGSGGKNEFIEHAQELHKAGVTKLHLEPIAKGSPALEKYWNAVNDSAHGKKVDTETPRQELLSELRKTWDNSNEGNQKLADMVAAAAKAGIKVEGTEPPGVGVAMNQHETTDQGFQILQNAPDAVKQNFQKFFDPNTSKEDAAKAGAEVAKYVRENWSQDPAKRVDSEGKDRAQVFNEFLRNGRATGLDLRNVAGKTGPELRQALTVAQEDWRNSYWAKQVAQSLHDNPNEKAVVFAGTHFGWHPGQLIGLGKDNTTFNEKLQGLGYPSTAVTLAGGDVLAYVPSDIESQNTFRDKSGAVELGLTKRFSYPRTGDRLEDVVIHLPTPAKAEDKTTKIEQ